MVWEEVVVFALKVAVTFMFRVIVPLHVVDVPAKAQSPPHPAKTELESGAAVRVTAVPDANTVPDGFDVMVPEPVPAVAVVRVYVVVVDVAAAWEMRRMCTPPP